MENLTEIEADIKYVKNILNKLSNSFAKVYRNNDEVYYTRFCFIVSQIKDMFF